MKRKAFFRHWGSILLFSVGGTVLSTLLIAFSMHTAMNRHWITSYDEDNDINGTLSVVTSRLIHTDHVGNMPLVDCLILGALLSAVDPSPGLSAIPLEMNDQIYSLLFGETVLNGAISIVLYNGFRMYHAVLMQRGPDADSDMESADATRLMARFLLISVASSLMGIAIGLLSAFSMKRVHRSLNPGKEQALMFLFAYLSYLLPREMGLSPVVSIFLCGVVMAHYTFHSLSRMSQVASVTWFRTIGHVAETFVFVFIGASAVTVNENEWRWDLIGFIILICLVARFVQVFLLSLLLNGTKWLWSKRVKFSCVRRMVDPNDELEPRYLDLRSQLFISSCGLRGAVAFALGIHSPIFNQEGEMLTTSISIVVFTFVVQGCTLKWLAVYLGLISPTTSQRNFEEALDIDRLTEDDQKLGSSIFRLASSSRPRHNSPMPSSYGTFANSWREFDEIVMKPVFGGEAREYDPMLQRHVSALEHSASFVPDEIVRHPIVY